LKCGHEPETLQINMWFRDRSGLDIAFKDVVRINVKDQRFLPLAKDWRGLKWMYSGHLDTDEL